MRAQALHRSPERVARGRGRSPHSRHLRDRRRLRRPLGRGRGGRIRRAGGADRKGQDGRRLPQLWLRARPRRCSPPRSTPIASRRVDAVRPHAAARGDRLRQGARACARRDRGDRAERFTGALHRPRRAGDRRRGALQGCRDRHGRRQVRDQGAALRDRDRLVAGDAADPGARRDAVSHQRNDLRAQDAARSISSSSARGRSGSSSRRRTGGSARR